MADMMTFPNTVEEFMEQYKITDTEQIYTNGAELVPVFRMKQWFDHKPEQPERKTGRWLRYGEDGYPNNEDTVFWQCDQCLEQYTGRTERIPNFCPNCGARMEP